MLGKESFFISLVLYTPFDVLGVLYTPYYMLHYILLFSNFITLNL